MTALVERLSRFGDQPWTKNGRLGFRLIVISCLVTIVVAFSLRCTVSLGSLGALSSPNSLTYVKT